METNAKDANMHRSETRKEVLYRAMVANGGSIPDDPEEWRRIGEKAGYIGYRDLAGFYGGLIPSMSRTKGERRLTAAGWERARRYRTT